MMTIHENDTKQHEATRKSTLLLVLLRDPFRVISWIVSFLIETHFQRPVEGGRCPPAQRRATESSNIPS